MSLLCEVCSNDVSGVLLVCISMHDRLDESAIETIATLHNKFEKDIWKKTVIALTKADQYPRDEWLKSKKWFNKAEPILKSEFERYLQKCTNIVQKFIVSPHFSYNEVTMSRIDIGMSEASEYVELEIPTLPTVHLSVSVEIPGLSKMTCLWDTNTGLTCNRSSAAIKSEVINSGQHSTHNDRI